MDRARVSASSAAVRGAFRISCARGLSGKVKPLLACFTAGSLPAARGDHTPRAHTSDFLLSNSDSLRSFSCRPSFAAKTPGRMLNKAVTVGALVLVPTFKKEPSAFSHRM